MKKERYEWIQSWCDEADREDKPRVLLVGDSITRGYQQFVRERLAGVCYVDYVATSYAIDNKMYQTLVEGVAKNSRYDVIHVNHGLHGIHVSPRTYKSKLRDLCLRIRGGGKLILAECTAVYRAGNKRLNAEWAKRIRERNEILGELATQLDCELDRLYEVSMEMPKEWRDPDGVHYLEEGYGALAYEVVKCLKGVMRI